MRSTPTGTNCRNQHGAHHLLVNCQLQQDWQLELPVLAVQEMERAFLLCKKIHDNIWYVTIYKPTKNASRVMWCAVSNTTISNNFGTNWNNGERSIWVDWSCNGESVQILESIQLEKMDLRAPKQKCHKKWWDFVYYSEAFKPIFTVDWTLSTRR